MSKIYFQGTFGAYSHLAAQSVDPKAEVKLLMSVSLMLLKMLMQE